LHGIGAWQHLGCDRVQPVESMLIQGDRGASLEFTAYELGERALAWIVEERSLRAGLVPLVRTGGVSVLAPQEFGSVAWSADYARVHFADGYAVDTRLLVGADGLRSPVREAAGIVAALQPYGQTAVVANFATERAHHGRAWQWFRPDGGILAWLPLPGRRMSMVWSAPTSLAEELLALPPAALAIRAAEAGDHALGSLRCLTPAAGFPLSSLRLPAVIAHRLALVGDAAHGVHPLAGQGVNLGFGDAEALAAVLRTRGPIADPATPFLLERYARRRAEPVRAMHAVTDGLARLFGAGNAAVRTARNAGLTAVDRLPMIKRMLARAALR
jgi:2-octaprenyl-6-methoxyphenol hydroxylase